MCQELKAGVPPCLPSGSEQETQTGHTKQARLRGSTHSIFSQVLYFLLPTGLFFLIIVVVVVGLVWGWQGIHSGISDKENLSLWGRMQGDLGDVTCPFPRECHCHPPTFPLGKRDTTTFASPCDPISRAQGLFIPIPQSVLTSQDDADLEWVQNFGTEPCSGPREG